MEWIGWLSLIILVFYSAYPGRVKKLESKVKKLEKNKRVEQEGDLEMSKIIADLVGKKCKIQTEDALQIVGSPEIECNVLEVDEEWIKFSFVDKKKIEKIKIIKIEEINSVEILVEE